MEQDQYIAVLTDEGYHADGHGHKKVTENVTHWVTLFDDSLQMYGYSNEDVNQDFDMVYDTGVVKMMPAVLGVFIQFFNKNHQ